MCGIGAILRTDGESIPDSWLDAMDTCLAGRGPDGQGRFRDRAEIATDRGRRTVEVALVHHRLSIIDHAGGGQPMVSAGGRDESEGFLAVIFNGCIYNHRELRRKLEARGHVFATDHSDTEVLLHGHREWGEGLQEHLEGMYAFAVWDRAAASLTLARDWFGEKPLYYRMDGEGDQLRCLVAASSAAAVSAVPGAGTVDVAARRAWVTGYLRFGYGPDGSAVCGNAPIFKVAPSGPFVASGLPSNGAREVHFDDVERLLEQAVSRRLEADVPLGCFLSGGVDSSLIAYYALKHKPDLQTFCVRMPDPRYDESVHAQRVADHLGCKHETLDAEANPARDLVMLIETLGHPFADSSILPTYWLSKAARQHVKVALAGDGGDELFIGYERYLAADVLARHWRLLQRIPRWLGHRAHPKSRRHKLARLGDMARDYPQVGVLATEQIFSTSQLVDLLGEMPSTVEADGGLDTLRLADLRGYLPDDLLCKVDTASMAVGLEVRCPMLDRDLAHALLEAPTRQLTPGGKRKGLLRQIARRHLPASAVERPKMGFAVPVGEWFRMDFGGLRGLLLDHLNSIEPFGPIRLDRFAIRHLLDEHMGGRRDHGPRLFALLALSIWARGTASGKGGTGRVPS